MKVNTLKPTECPKSTKQEVVDSHYEHQNFAADLVNAINTATSDYIDEEKVDSKTEAVGKYTDFKETMVVNLLKVDGEEFQSNKWMDSQEPPNATSSKHVELTGGQRTFRRRDWDERIGSTSWNININAGNWTLPKTRLSKQIIKAKKARSPSDASGPSQ
ncbi:hypothetical protein JAAARDRAFT_197100 [Jaapia argillacea MUCL 33604]|uniref:Uncharacterized protein n=1 Tax=Jaapia argillacea MUCL 33604 TaxID=933084 RepID=A0A067PGH6_9AGAM|nr:hypothetical protein JAAARDRAFT_197100 [Jaapia argillacea MUCL 33604]